MNISIRPMTLNELVKESFEKFPEKVAFEMIGGDSVTYGSFKERVNKLRDILDRNNIRQGEKVALLGGSMPNWPVSYIAVTTSSRIVVPLLPDFTAYEIANIIEHSEARAIIISKRLIYKLSDHLRSKLDLIVCLDELKELKVSSDNNPDTVDQTGVDNAIMVPMPPKPEDIASIIYTSGTSGASKGVMLTHCNIASNIQQTRTIFSCNENDVFLSFLPLSHAYECTLAMLFPMAAGATVYYLNGAPTPSLLMPALKKVRPTIMSSVPLIVEKIYKNKVRPMFTKNWFMQVLYSIGPVRSLLHKVAGSKMLEMFGGRLRLFAIGGAKLDASVEKFLKDAKFPYAIGYGLTECSPLIAGQVDDVVFQSTGRQIEGDEIKIYNPDPHGVGEIIVRGPNIMKGYYKDEARTKAAFLEGGWFRTKDLGAMDKKDNLTIKGRVDNMLIGASGENIYPEEIEAVLNDNDFVLESLVVKQEDRLVAKVHFNYDQIASLIDFKEVEEEVRKNLSEKYEKITDRYEELYKKYENWKREKGYNVAERISKPKEKVVRKEVVVTFEEKFEKVRTELLQFVNERVNKSSKISEIIEQSVPFQKTATQKIKRYLYR